MTHEVTSTQPAGSLRCASAVQSVAKPDASCVEHPSRRNGSRISAGSSVQAGTCASALSGGSPVVERGDAAIKSSRVAPKMCSARLALKVGSVVDGRKRASRTSDGTLHEKALSVPTVCPSPPQPAEASITEVTGAHSTSQGVADGVGRCSGRSNRAKARARCGGDALRAHQEGQRMQAKSSVTDAHEALDEGKPQLPAAACGRIGTDSKHLRDFVAPLSRVIRAARSQLLIAAVKVAGFSGISPRGVLAALLLLAAIITCSLVVAMVLVLQLQSPMTALGHVSGCLNTGLGARGGTD